MGRIDDLISRLRRGRRRRGCVSRAWRTTPPCASRGVVRTDVGPAGLFVSAGDGERVEGVTCVAAGDGGYEISLRLVCALTPLRRSPSRCARVLRKRSPAGIPVASVNVQVADVAGPEPSDGAVEGARPSGRHGSHACPGTAGSGDRAFCLDGLISLGSLRPDRLLRLPGARLHRPLPGPARRGRIDGGVGAGRRCGGDGARPAARRRPAEVAPAAAGRPFADDAGTLGTGLWRRSRGCCAP